MQSVSPRIWSRVAESISYDDNHYTTGTSNKYTKLIRLYKNNYFAVFNYKLVGWVFHVISTFVSYLTLNPFYANNQLYFKQFNSTWVQSLIVKTVSISNYSV